MSIAFRAQGMLFCVVALGLAALGPWLPPINGHPGLLLVGGLTLLLGVPHGALDPVFARRLHAIDRASRWLLFGLCYSVVASLVVLCWLAAPTLFLITFLLLSAAHFSGDLEHDVPSAAMALYGGAIIVLPALFHADQMALLLNVLVGPDSAQWITQCLRWLAWPWLAGMAAAVLTLWRRLPRTTLELAALAALALFAPLLYAFTAFFCLMHGARHILRTVAYAGDRPIRQIAALALLPMAIVSVVSLAMVARIDVPAFNASVVQIIFVGLAALTVPHMTLVERVRHAGWQQPAACGTPTDRRKP